ncbi:MAG: hypothetical protein M3Q36_03355 [bacterium]|nr:hypothetical protein [bacterium]
MSPEEHSQLPDSSPTRHSLRRWNIAAVACIGLGGIIGGAGIYDNYTEAQKAEAASAEGEEMRDVAISQSPELQVLVDEGFIPIDTVANTGVFTTEGSLPASTEQVDTESDELNQTAETLASTSTVASEVSPPPVVYEAVQPDDGIDSEVTETSVIEPTATEPPTDTVAEPTVTIGSEVSPSSQKAENVVDRHNQNYLDLRTTQFEPVLNESRRTTVTATTVPEITVPASTTTLAPETTSTTSTTATPDTAPPETTTTTVPEIFRPTREGMVPNSFVGWVNIPRLATAENQHKSVEELRANPTSHDLNLFYGDASDDYDRSLQLGLSVMHSTRTNTVLYEDGSTEIVATNDLSVAGETFRGLTVVGGHNSSSTENSGAAPFGNLEWMQKGDLFQIVQQFTANDGTIHTAVMTYEVTVPCTNADDPSCSAPEGEFLERMRGMAAQDYEVQRAILYSCEGDDDGDASALRMWVTGELRHATINGTDAFQFSVDGNHFNAFVADSDQFTVTG